MIEDANSLLIIDHHITAQNDLIEIPNENKIFDMNHSGAYLTWKYMFSDDNIPMLIRYIEDRDLWKHEVPDSKYFFARFKDLPFDFNIYNELLTDAKI